MSIQTKAGRDYENKRITRILLIKTLIPKIDAARIISQIIAEGYGK